MRRVLTPRTAHPWLPDRGACSCARPAANEPQPHSTRRCLAGPTLSVPNQPSEPSERASERGRGNSFKCPRPHVAATRSWTMPSLRRLPPGLCVHLAHVYCAGAGALPRPAILIFPATQRSLLALVETRQRAAAAEPPCGLAPGARHTAGSAARAADAGRHATRHPRAACWRPGRLIPQ